LAALSNSIFSFGGAAAVFAKANDCDICFWLPPKLFNALPRRPLFALLLLLA
jgi:hypothetical protein